MKLTKEQIAEAIGMRKAGKSVRWLAAHFHVNRTTVWKITGGKDGQAAKQPKEAKAA